MKHLKTKMNPKTTPLHLDNDVFLTILILIISKNDFIFDV
jgi:hypothetical protein